MPLTEAGIYYADTSTTMSIADITAAMATSVSSKLNGIAQIVYSSTNTQTNSTTSSYVSTGLSATITPKFATSKLIVLISQNGIGKNGASTTGGMNIKLQKDGVDVSTFIGANTLYDSAAGFVSSSASFIYAETSGSNTPRTFRTVFNLQIGTGTMNMQRDGATSTMIILEVIQ